MEKSNLPRKTSSVVGALLLLSSRNRYLSAAVDHSVYLDIEDRQQWNQFKDGAYTPNYSKIQTDELRRFEGVRYQLRNSFVAALITLVTALLIGFGAGVIDSSLQFQLSRVSGVLGTFLVTWATLFELGGNLFRSYGGQTLSEIAHPKIFQLLFIPGAFSLIYSYLC